MRLFKTLAKKCLRDFGRNIKQFISIIFIIAIAVTLYVGFEANSESFENRVNLAYSEEYGNLSDIWITFNPDYDDFTNGTLEEEQEDIQEIIGEDSSLETRLYIPATMENETTYGLISYEMPTINKPYNIETDYSLSNSSPMYDFFYVDYGYIENYQKADGTDYELGDELTIAIDLTYFDGLDTYLNQMIVDNYESIADVIVSLVYMFDDSLQEYVESLLTGYETQITETITSQISSYFSENTSLECNVEITGFMNHPENLQSGEFYSNVFLMGSRTFFKALVSTLFDGLNSESIISMIDEIFEGNTSSEAELIKLIIESFINSNSETVDEFITLLYSYLENYVDDEENTEFVESLRNLYNQYVIKLSDDKDVDEVMTELQSYFDNRTSSQTSSSILAILDRDSYPSCIVLSNDINQSKQMTYIFPIIFFVVAVLVVLTTITQMILKERTQIGTMKALGISKPKIFAYYAILFSLVTIIGVALGYIIGPLLVPYVMNIKYGLLYELPTITYVFPAASSLITLFVLLGLVVLITFFITYKELIECPAASMRPKSPSINIKKKKETKTKNTSIMMAFRNIRVHPAKSIMVIIGVMGCCGLLICGMGIDDTLNSGIAVDLENILGADLTASYSGNPTKGEMAEKILAIDGIDSVYEYASLYVTVSDGEDNNSSEALYLFSKDTINFKYTSWDLTYTDDSGETYYNCGLSESIAKEIDVSEGDIIEVTYNNEILEFHVAKVFFTFAARAVYVYDETVNLVSYRNSNWINVEKDEDDNWIVDSDTLVYELSQISGISTIATYDDNVERVEGYLSSIKYMTNTIKVFALLLAIIVVINLSILNYEERSRDLATLRVLGFSRSEIGSSLIIESVTLTVIGAILGMFIGWPLEYAVLQANITTLVAWNYHIYWYTYLIAFVVSLVVSVVVNLLLTTKINKIDMSESLKSIE